MYLLSKTKSGFKASSRRNSIKAKTPNKILNSNNKESPGKLQRCGNHLTPLQKKLIDEMEDGNNGLHMIESARNSKRGIT